MESCCGLTARARIVLPCLRLWTSSGWLSGHAGVSGEERTSVAAAAVSAASEGIVAVAVNVEVGWTAVRKVVISTGTKTAGQNSGGPVCQTEALKAGRENN